MSSFATDLRLALQAFARRPLLAAAAILSLALGIGANTAIFTVINGVVLQPLPLPEPDRLTVVWETKDDNRHITISASNFVDWRERNQVFEHLAIVQNSRFNLIGGDEPERVEGVRVSPSIFEVLRVEPLLGRGFAAREDEPGSHTVVVLGHDFWQRRFAGDDSIVGRTLLLDTESYEVVGVLPPEFQWPLPHPAQIFVPRVFAPAEISGQSRHVRFHRALGRLQPGVELSAAQAEMDRVASWLEEEYPDANTGWGINVIPLHEEVVGAVRPTLRLLFAAVGVVLLVACANVASLMLVRGLARQRETALRLALGANRWHLSRLWIAESSLLALLGGGLGLVLAYAGTRALVALAPPDLPRLDAVAVDHRVLLFTLVATLLTGVIFALVPLLGVSRLDPQTALKDGGGKTTGGLRHRRLHGSMVAFESALALVLLVGAGLLLTSFDRLRQVDPGFATAGRTAFQIFLPRTKYPDDPSMAAFSSRLLERIEALPNVISAGLVTTLPMATGNLGAYAFVEGEPPPEPGQEPTAAFDAASPGYFETLDIPLRSGRFFDQRDHAEAPPVMMINETMAERFFPDQNPLGRRISYSSAQGPYLTIVGVVGDIKHRGLDTETRAEMYHPFVQGPLFVMNLVIETANEAPAGLVNAVREAVWEVDPDQPVRHLGSLGEVVAQSLAERRFTMILLALFAAITLLLGAIGIYGVVSHLVSRGTQEVGIRMAFGARRGNVLGLVLRRGLIPVALGIALGTAVALISGRLVSGMLFEVRASDPATFVAVAALLVAVALVACLVPARRATRIDPVDALRYE